VGVGGVCSDGAVYQVSQSSFADLLSLNVAAGRAPPSPAAEESPSPSPSNSPPPVGLVPARFAAALDPTLAAALQSVRPPKRIYGDPKVAELTDAISHSSGVKRAHALIERALLLARAKLLAEAYADASVRAIRS
jgi:hypothetical protein